MMSRGGVRITGSGIVPWTDNWYRLAGKYGQKRPWMGLKGQTTQWATVSGYTVQYGLVVVIGVLLSGGFSGCEEQLLYRTQIGGLLRGRGALADKRGT